MTTPDARPPDGPPVEPAGEGSTAGTGRWPRRRVLKLGVAAGAVSLLGGLRLGCYGAPARIGGLRNLGPTEAAILVAILDTILPPRATSEVDPASPDDAWGGDRSAARTEERVRFVDRYLTGLDAADVRQLRGLFWIVEHGTLLEGKLRRFTRLPASDRADVIRGWQTSSLGLRRLGYRSLKALCFLAYYRDDAAFASIGYPGPLMREGWKGPPESQALYDALLAPADAVPGAGA